MRELALNIIQKHFLNKHKIKTTRILMKDDADWWKSRGREQYFNDHVHLLLEGRPVLFRFRITREGDLATVSFDDGRGNVVEKFVEWRRTRWVLLDKSDADRVAKHMAWNVLVGSA